MKKQFREKHEEGRDRQVKLQQIVSAMKNPVSAFALSVFLYGVSVAPATRYALAGIRHSDFAPLFETSDWIALLLCFVVGMMVIAVGFIDKRCSTWLIRAGREEDARLCAWLEFRCERRLFVSMLCVLFPGSFALFLWVWDCFIGVILVVAVISFAPVLLIYGAHGIQQERNLLEGAGVVGRDLIGSLLPWAICPVLMVSPLLSGGAIFELETPECFAIFCCLLALLLCICCLCGAYTRIRKMR